MTGLKKWLCRADDALEAGLKSVARHALMRAWEVAVLLQNLEKLPERLPNDMRKRLIRGPVIATGVIVASLAINCFLTGFLPFELIVFGCPWWLPLVISDAADGASPALKSIGDGAYLEAHAWAQDRLGSNNEQRQLLEP